MIESKLIPNALFADKNLKSVDKLKEIDQTERKILRDQGVKFGRYHIFLYKLLKPSIVSLRLILWKN